MEKRSIQREILTKLLSVESMRYSEARPDGVESDLFNYHLKSLVQKGYVKKDIDQYSLTDLGKIRISSTDILQPTGQKFDLFKLGIHLIVIRKKKDNLETLYQIRKKHPLFGKKSIVSGPMSRGEFPVDAAHRILKDETGLIGNFKLIGFVRKTSYNAEKQVIGDTLYHICITHNPSGELKENTIFGDNFWCDINEAIKIEKNKILPIKEELKILNLLKDGKNIEDLDLFYKEETQVVTGDML